MITIVDYGMGNLRSVVKAVEKYSDSVQVSSDPGVISNSDALIMPGDGAFGMAMENLYKLGWVEPLKEYINSNKPFLGICLGFQLLFTESEEFKDTKGLDIIKGMVKKFPENELKVPHMGWNNVSFVNKSIYLNDILDKSQFYFIHSYYPDIKDLSWKIGEVNYGLDFTCVVGKGKVLATQFHPEKSHDMGLKIIKNFVDISQKTENK